MVQLVARYSALLVALVVANFALPRLLPGDPLDFGASDGLDTSMPLSSTARAQLEAYYHLDDPVWIQFRTYLNDLTRGDFGFSIARAMPVRDLILDRLPWTMGLLATTLIVSAVLGTTIGVIAGWRPGSHRDRSLMSAAGMLDAIPEFLIAISLLLGGAVGLGWFPLFGGKSVFVERSDGVSGVVERGTDIVWHLTLPALTLIVAGVSSFVIFGRNATADVLSESWLTAARAKGLTETRIATRHALPNLAPQLLTFFGLRLGGLLGGAIVVERIFSIPGLGQLGFQAINARDYPVLQALFLFSGILVLGVTFLLELIYLRVATNRGPAK